MRGQMGVQGAQGPTGRVGPPGADAQLPEGYGAGGAPAAADYRPTAWFNCAAGLDLIGTDGSKETLLFYQLTVFSNRDTEASCKVGMGSAVQGAGNVYYPSQATGSLTGSCVASGDFPPTDDNQVGVWEFLVPRGGGGPRALYSDIASHPLHGYTYVYKDGDCTVMKVGADGNWSTVTLTAFY